MKYKPKFKRDNPETKEEKLICELQKYLHDSTVAFININRATCTDNEIFITIRDGALAYVGQTIEALLSLMACKNEKPLFLKECQDIFNRYIEQAFNSIEENK